MTIINSVIKGKQPVIDTLNVTPTTSPQQITAPQGTDGYSPVNVSAVTSSIDANIVAGNIKKDVQILGVTGSYEGTTPTGTVNITSNGTHNVSSYEYAEVLVPTTAPSRYLEYTTDANGKLIHDPTAGSIINLNGVTDVDNYVLANAYYNNTNITGTVDFSSLKTVNGIGACANMFGNCTGITGVILGVEYSNGQSACASMFSNCTGLTSIDISSIIYVPGSYSCQYMFSGCTGLTGTIDLSSLLCGGIQTFQYMFQNCTGITGTNLSTIKAIGSNEYGNMFNGCTNLSSVNINYLCKLGTQNSLANMFRNCTSLTSLSFPNLAYTATNINNAFSNTLQGVTGCTVHFPAEWQTTMSSWTNITNGMGGTNTTVLFDLPNVTIIDLSCVRKVEYQYIVEDFCRDNVFPNVTGVDLSNLIEVTSVYGCRNICNGSTGITSVKLDSLKDLSGTGALYYAFAGTSLTTLSFPALKTISTTGNPLPLANMLSGVTGCTVHFPSNLSGTTGIDASTIKGTNTTVLFDLPATNILTGADTKEYERNPKYDTTTALAWRINGTMPNTTTYYTSGLTDPTVGTTIYSDSACTIAETTVDSIS